MKKFYLFKEIFFSFKVVFALFILILFNSGMIFSQGTPQYYNSNAVGVGGNAMPFGMGQLPPFIPHEGVKYQTMLGPSAFINPGPAPSGNITKLYFQIAPLLINLDGTYSDLTIKLGQTSDTDFTAGQYFSGSLTTVFFRANYAVTIGSNTYISFDLDNAFAYDQGQSLVIQVSSCGPSAGGFHIIESNGPVGSLRRNHQATATCEDFPPSQDRAIPNCGIDVTDPVLPVELTSFVASTDGNNVTLNWSTINETNNAGFDIERQNAKGETQDVWKKVGNVNGNGTTAIGQSYTFKDRNLSSGKYTYRLKQIDFNGNFEYFNLTNEVNIGIPSKYDLSQNYPNPFNPTTSINYEIPFDGKVSLKIFDMSGREVATLVNEVKTAGYYSYNFNASNLSSGIYFYSLSASNFAATKKMMLIK